MPFFRKKPVMVEAWCNLPGQYGMPDWVTDAVTKVEDGTLSIMTLEGVMVAGVGDWIVKGVRGEVYPCKTEIFEETYLPAGETEYEWEILQDGFVVACGSSFDANEAKREMVRYAAMCVQDGPIKIVGHPELAPEQASYNAQLRGQKP